MRFPNPNRRVSTRRSGRSQPSAQSDEPASLELAKLSLEREKFEFERQKFARMRWWHEDGLVNNRLTWLLVSQALLFAAYATNAKDSSGTSQASTVEALANLIPLVGTMVACAVLAATFAACWAQVKLARDEEIGLGVSAVTTLLGWAPSVALPLLFAAAWRLAA